MAPYERAHRACIDAVAAGLTHLTCIAVQGVVSDDGIDTAAGKAENRMFVSRAADSDAFAAQYTAAGIVVDAGMAVVYFHWPCNPGQRLGFQAQLEEPGDVLEFTCAVGMAMPTVDIMDGEQ